MQVTINSTDIRTVCAHNRQIPLAAFVALIALIALVAHGTLRTYTENTTTRLVPYRTKSPNED